ncbi:trehalose-6-phosphate synthase [Halobium palmae]|uniref:Trehalose-6-phosphate synthase n=1 Tax=Halobium palmae TaxID=1776492 RepID=A0ABD5S0I0_9EURY
MADDSDPPNGPDAPDVESLLDGGQLLVVSNRQPYSHGYDETGEVAVSRPAGGLTAGLDPVMQRVEGTWIAWGDGEADREVADEDDAVEVPPEDPSYRVRRVWLTDEEVDQYYYGYSNRVLWPLCHGGIWKTDFADEHREAYEAVNRKFARAVREEADDDAVVWFQDYHFTRAPGMVRESMPEAFLMHFWHITWPGWDTFRSLPHGEQTLEGLLGNDLVGFHTGQYVENFLDCIERGLDGATVDRGNDRIEYDGRTTDVEAFPLSVDFDAIAASAECFDSDDWDAFREEHGIATDRVAVGVDRLDYTKGVPERLNALEQLWENHPEWRGELTYVQKASESRSIIPDYRDLQDRVVNGVERINDRFGTDGWTPVVYLDEHLDGDTLNGMYRHSDVLLVSALRDGMNLVAKEFVAAQVDEDGVLVLSNQTGAYEELGKHSVTINPHDIDEFADAIGEALRMDESDRRERMRTMRQWVESHDLSRWMHDVFASAADVRMRRRMGME